MAQHPSVAARLGRLTPDQRAAATAPPGPVLCIAPAGSGKTTTLIARIAWLADGGVDPGSIAAITFNKRAAAELDERLTAAVEPLGLPAGAIRVRTFHALGREILVDAGVGVDPLVDRLAVLRRIAPTAGPAGWRRLDDAISRLKLDLGVTADQVAADPEAGPIARAFVAYERAIATTGGLDFDDLVARALRRLATDEALLTRWRARCAHLLVDEVQDVDRSQLDLALLLAAPEDRIFLVGDDDQSIYGWRLADVRRLLDLGGRLPGLRRVDLVTNFRCPTQVVERAVRLVEGNRARFAKRIRARPGAVGRLILAPDGRDDIRRVGRLLDGWAALDGSLAVLARTNRELLPVAVAALERGIPFRASGLRLPLEAPGLEALLGDLLEGAGEGEGAVKGGSTADLLLQLGRLRAAIARGGEGAGAVAPGPPAGSVSGASLPAVGTAPHQDPSDANARFVDLEGARSGRGAEESPAGLVAALLAWAPRHRDVFGFVAAVRAARDRLAALRRDDARLTLATAHATKGLEFDHVAVLGMEADRFPSRRSLDEAADPAAALEEERRLAYVAWTRARRSLTLMYDPESPSRFLREAFDPDELGGAPPDGSSTDPGGVA